MNALKTKIETLSDKRSKQVEFVPPSEEQIERYAADVCQKLDEQQKSDCPDRDTRQSFTEFIKLVVKIETKHRNPGGHHVKRRNPGGHHVKRQEQRPG